MHLVRVCVERPQDLSGLRITKIRGEQSRDQFSNGAHPFQAPGDVRGGQGKKRVQRPGVLLLHEHALDEAAGSVSTC